MRFSKFFYTPRETIALGPAALVWDDETYLSETGLTAKTDRVSYVIYSNPGRHGDDVGFPRVIIVHVYDRGDDSENPMVRSSLNRCRTPVRSIGVRTSLRANRVVGAMITETKNVSFGN